MKNFFKIFIVCIAIFSLCLYITKISIDSTFKKAECNKVVIEYPSFIIDKIIEV